MSFGKHFIRSKTSSDQKVLIHFVVEFVAFFAEFFCYRYNLSVFCINSVFHYVNNITLHFYYSLIGSYADLTIYIIAYSYVFQLVWLISHRFFVTAHMENVFSNCSFNKNIATFVVLCQSGKKFKTSGRRVQLVGFNARELKTPFTLSGRNFKTSTLIGHENGNALETRGVFVFMWTEAILETFRKRCGRDYHLVFLPEFCSPVILAFFNPSCGSW